MKWNQRIISGFLASCLAMSMLPAAVFAEEPYQTEGSTTVAEKNSVLTGVEAGFSDESTVSAHFATGPSTDTMGDSVEESATSSEIDPLENPVDVDAITEGNASIIASDTCGDNLTWTLDFEGTLTISGTGAMMDVSWFDVRMDIKKVMIEHGVTTIVDRAFYECSNLSGITIPDSVAEIDTLAFYNCTQLTQISIPEGVTSIADSAFVNCSGLVSIQVDPENCVYASDATGTLFSKDYTVLVCCPRGLTGNYIIPERVTAIGPEAFNSCSSLTSIEIPRSVASIGVGAFESCSSLTTITIPEGVPSIPNFAFSFCKGLKNVTIPESVTSIGSFSFEVCSSLTSITIPECVTDIGESAFRDCNTMTDVYYGGTDAEWQAISIGRGNNCLTSAAIHFTETEDHEHIYGDWYETKAPSKETEGEERRDCSVCDDYETRAIEKLTHTHSYTSEVTQPTCVERGYVTHTCACGESYVSDYIDALGHNYLDSFCTRCGADDPDAGIVASGICGDNLTWQLNNEGLLTIFGTGEMYNYSFYEAPWYEYQDQIETVIMRDGITEIGSNAFFACTTPTTIVIPESVTSIGDSAFNGCKKLAAITIPESVTSIGENAFCGCSSLVNIVIPSGITRIENWTFYACTSLASIEIPDTVTYIGSSAFEECSRLVEITLPDGITSIGAQTFFNCSNLIRIIIPNTVSSVDRYAFYNCISLTAVKLPSALTTIPSNIFIGCTSLKSITISEGTTHIDAHAFEDLIALTNIVLPDSIVSIGKAAFAGCKSLAHITIPSSITQIEDYTFSSCYNLQSIIIPDSVSSIGESAFNGCSSLSNITIPNSVTSIGDHAFHLCYGLTSIDIPNNVTYVGSSTFFDCDSLTRVTISGRLNRIEEHTFYHCDNLASISIPDSVTHIGSRAFSDCSNLKEILYSGSEEKWRSITIEDGNMELYSATKHYTSPGPDDGISDEEDSNYAIEQVYLFTKWDSESQIVHLDDGSEMSFLSLGYRVTEQTDKSFLTNVDSLLGTYVLAKTKANINGDISTLLSMKPLETKTGTVTALSSNTITIDGTTYILPDSLKDLGIKVGDTVMYHLYAGQLVGINGQGFVDSGNDNDDTDKPDDINSKSSVRYYSSWDSSNGAVWFGSNNSDKYLVTEETDISFQTDPTKHLGQYVLVTTKENNFGTPDILLSVKPVLSKTGTVTYADSAKITIDGIDYLPPKNSSLSPALYAKRFVVYHLYNGELVSIELPEAEDGMLTYWNKETHQLTIDPDGLYQPATDFILSPLATEETLTILGNTGFTNRAIRYTSTGNLILEILNHSDGPEFDKPVLDQEQTQEDIACGYLIDYRDEWEEAYERYIKAVEQALYAYSSVDIEVSKEQAIKSQAEEMKANDSKLGTSKYISGNLGKYENIAYEALATYFYEVVRNGIPELSSIDVSGTWAEAEIINNIIANISSETKEYTIDGITVQLIIGDYFGLEFGHMKIKSNTYVICSKPEKCKEAFIGLIEELKVLATNSAYNIASAVYQDILGKPITSYTKEYLNDVTSKIENMLAVELATYLQTTGVGNLIKNLDECYTLYTWANKAINAMHKSDIQEALDEIYKLDFSDKTITDAFVKKEMKELQKATTALKRAFKECIEGTLVEKEQGFWRTYINCPVTIAIYNSNGTQIGYVGSDGIWHTDTIRISQYGNVKEIISLTADIPTFIITATDYGTMNCSFEERADPLAPIGRLNFYDVMLEPGKTYEINMVNNLADNWNTIPLVSHESSVYADEYISPQGASTALISCDILSDDGLVGGSIYGTGHYTAGDLVVLCAEPSNDYSFNGWYENNNLVSNSISYEFVATNDKTLTARFTPISTASITILCDGGGFALGEGTYPKSKTVLLSAVPEDEYKFSGWYIGDVILSQDMHYTLSATNDITITAYFEKNDHISHDTDILWHFDNTYHWQQCTDCSKKLEFATHSGGTATNTEKAICTVCGASYGELTPTAAIGSMAYTSLAEALAAAQPGDVVQLLQDTRTEDVIIRKGVGVDLNGYTLEADYIFAVKGAEIADNSEGNTGLLKVDAKHVMISKENAQLPVWNGEGYVFTTVTYKTRLMEHDNDKLKFAFLPQFKAGATALLEDGVDGNKVTIEVRVSWLTKMGREYRNLVFNEQQVDTVVGTNGAFILTFSGFSQLDMASGITVEGIVISETGVSIASEAIVVEV